MATITCSHCEAAIEAHYKFCRHCGASLTSHHATSQADEDNWSDLDELDIISLEEVADIATLAVPDDFTQIGLEELRTRVVQAICISAMGFDPYASREFRTQSLVDNDEKTEDRTALGGWVQAPDHLNYVVERCHATWSNGLISHLNLTSDQAERVGRLLARVGYRVDLCDCDKVGYVPSKTNPGYLRRA